ncbi:peptidylprolyl isomerase [Fusobacterium sp.]|uniref:peptidylprolyl isomerase n=1 Tax=Fusobacterium sp. TaxID=68766 RepID=UPI0025B9AAC7|nr:peptidylprolyl isomerase [Fusobacterium sp.]
MKRLLKYLMTLVLVFSAFSCTSLRELARREEAAKYNDIRATFVTTQGEISFYLYPEAAPITVANFINLAQRGFYNNTKIHRAVENFMVQGGDPTGTGTGGPGYFIPDENVEWLDFFQQGMLAMANAGPETGGSQFFITLYPAEWLNGKHTIFGEYVSDSDFEKIKKLEVGDIIKEIKFSGDIDFFLSLHKDQIDQWNKVLDTTYPGLKEYTVKPIEDYQGEALAYKDELTRIYTRNEKTDEEREWPIPRFIRAVEKKIKGEEEVATDSYDF